MSMNLLSQTISINQTVNADTVIYPFEGVNTSYGLKITGNILLNSDTSLVRAILLKAARVYPDDRPLFHNTSDSRLQLMPNPAKNFVIIAYDLGNERAQGIILIRDSKGVLIKNLGLHKAVNQVTVDLNGIPSGFYLVSLFAGNKHIESRQLSVAR